MNLMNFISRGAAHAPNEDQRAEAAIAKATEDTRSRWLDALMVDETRTWMGLGQADRGVIEGMTTMLAIAGFAQTHDAKSSDTPDLRVIRGAISAARQCMERGAVVEVADARAFSSAASRARVIITGASRDAIIYAAQTIRETVGL